MPETNTVETFFKNQISKSKEILELVKNPFVKKEEEHSVKKAVNLPNIPGEIFKSPDYKNYYHIVREKIRKLAYQNYKQLQEGEVFLTFSLDPQGNLLTVEVNEAKSVKDSYLRQIAIKSVKNGAPYPEFPKKLKNQKQLSFNVIISFELK
ncbi:MAG: energy transducer TonB [Candidatus Omnitrophota bacterium]